ncbi:hypothetical protein CCAX7_44690 [Capsulimonas corticalis]|uniref:Uncharacterized protein n=1 Tax=Capsulimonas corticalis TaxID=2219043 RepID=A0A402CX44_9BACT|nr:hypothetical protein [Capsulimonas corticalis]BDI32418.1 hypothetical protein CCAX7_44690 [Capsulimonas corticalis]
MKEFPDASLSAWQYPQSTREGNRAKPCRFCIRPEQQIQQGRAVSKIFGDKKTRITAARQETRRK